MAIIANDKFKIKVVPRYTNWWIFDFSFFYDDKPLLNPAITRDEIFSADEYESWGLLPVLEKAINCTENDQLLRWGAWEDDIEVEIRTHKLDIFDFAVFIDDQYFIDGIQTHGITNPGLKLLVNRDELKKFYLDLKSEMQKVPNAPKV